MVRENGKDRPLVILIQPPVYDFAFYDLFIKPLALLRLGAWFQADGYRVEIINYLDYREMSCSALTYHIPYLNSPFSIPA